jgi:PAS domain S-box-containing protein
LISAAERLLTELTNPSNPKPGDRLLNFTQDQFRQRNRDTSDEFSDALFELLMQAPTPLTLLTGPEHRFTFINAGYIRLLRRVSDESVLGKPVREALPELEGQGFYELLDRVYATGESFVGREVPGALFREASGLLEEAFFDFVYQPILNAEKAVYGIMVQATDVTESVRGRQESERRERLLHRQWSELESIYRTAPVGLCLINASNFEFMRANDLQSAMNGHPAEYLIGRTIREVVPDIADDVEELFRQVVAGKAVEKMEVGGEVPHQPGVHHDWIVNYFPLYAENGRVEAISCVTLEVTEQKRAQAWLRASEARWSAIYSSSPDYIWILSPDGTTLDCNNASLSFEDSARVEIVGKAFADGPWFRYTPGVPETVRQAIVRALRGEAVRMEMALVQQSGNVKSFDFAISPVRNSQGEIEFLVPEGRDITELKRTQAALIQSEKLAAVGRLASSISHEINNPLESVTNLIFLARQYAEREDVQQFLDMADQELRRVAMIANQTLRFHKQATNPQSISTQDLFSSVLRIYETKLSNANVRLEQQKFADEPVTCFQGDIRQVLLNVVGNAIDAMPLGGRLILRSRTATNWEDSRRGIVITVADTGKGMDAETRVRIFEPFFTTKGFMGNGLGMWISSEIVERHRGKLMVRSSQKESHRGTVVQLFLPFLMVAME